MPKPRALLHLVLSLIAASSAACGASAPAGQPRVAASRPPSERCPPDASNAPADARVRMEALKQDVFACFGLGTAPPRDGLVKVEITVDRAGLVGSTKVVAEGAESSAVRCTEGALRRAHFAAFCGADVPITWTYTLH